MRICVIGTGYVGLVTGAGFAETGNHVTCVDVDSTKIARLQAGEIPIYEPGLEDLVQGNRSHGRLTFSTDVAKGIAGAEVVFVTVGTPPRPDGGADLSFVDKAAETIADAMTGELVVVLKSTVPVGTHERVRRILKERAKHPFHVVSNPEFLKEGDAVADFMKPDRVVVGTDSEHARETMRRLYAPLTMTRERLVQMDPASAELTKYVANAMLAMRISFMNEVAALCERVGADVRLVRYGVGSDERIGPKFLYSGCGYGGSCFPKDVLALLHTGRELELELELVGATDRVNQRQKGVLLRKLKARYGGDLRGRRVGVWGISFKPRTDDIREAPALTLIDGLLAEGASVAAHDPVAMEAASARFGDRVELVENEYDAAKGADALVLVTEWQQYRSPDFAQLRASMRRPLLIDGRNVWAAYDLGEQGFDYEGIGVRASKLDR
ncbi:MAG: UDP-glucose/GDP-mannose dehydrogenase family protein [Deltaproteobacteria bacterium]|nr:UDP-glucose/GDP-mannose dehydrogenase family protein [Deltaproteobacteria bacterium]